jgi:predicted nucleic-acid-binding protein
MKLTKETLKQIIKEEIQAVLNEEKTALDRTDMGAVRAAARMIMKAEGLDADMLKHLKKALAGGHKMVAIVGGPDDGDTVELLKYVTYTK